MKENRTNALIAITCLIAAALMTFALSFAIGKWSWTGGSGHNFTIQFPNATGIQANTTVKYAGAICGRVTGVTLIPLKDRTQDKLTGDLNVVNVTINVDSDIVMTEDTKAIIMQDGIGIAAKYLLLTPGNDKSSPALASGAMMQGERPFDVTDLLQPTGEMIAQARNLVQQLQPTIKRVDELSVKLAKDLPPMIDHADAFLQNSNQVMANLNTYETKERLTEIVANLRVATDNLKVVSSNTKALTQTLAEKPWRVFWGGPTVQPPPENEVLKSNKVIRLKQDVEVTGNGFNTPDKSSSNSTNSNK